MRSFVKIKPSRNGEITLSFTDIGISCLSREFLTSQICLLTLFAKIKFSRNFRIYSILISLKKTYSNKWMTLAEKLNSFYIMTWGLGVE